MNATPGSPASPTDGRAPDGKPIRLLPSATNAYFERILQIFAHLSPE
jgi:hypothetical protein